MNIDKPFDHQIPLLRALWKEAFLDTDEFLDVFESSAFTTERCRCATIDGEIASALYWFDCSYDEHRVAYLYAIATAKKHRGKGICRELMENTHRHLAANGYDAAILVPGGKELFSFYERMGYRTCSFVKEFICKASSDTLEISKIDMGEYASLRKMYLPESSVIQEGENLTFLGATATLYKGEDFLLAAQKGEELLRGVELLGDVSKAPMILRTLGYDRGVFRTVGSDKPFAMYKLLYNGEFIPPRYFGLAFD